MAPPMSQQETANKKDDFIIATTKATAAAATTTSTTMPPEQGEMSITNQEYDNTVVGGDIELGYSADNKRTMKPKVNGKHLRWSRIIKTVDIKETGGGLLRGSIAGKLSPPKTSEEEQDNNNGDVNEKNKNKKEKHTKTTDRRRSSIRNSLTAAVVPTKTILNEISGSAQPGEVLALMGPSGSGKTSILDVLSGRSSYGNGTITVNGEVITEKVMKKLKKQIAYVKQSDIFFGHLTVRDQLTYTAFLRLPGKWEKQRKVDEVNKIINQLRLTKCADTPINMISGGEKKRVNIGTELLTNPSIIMLDEPTSGLDSTSAVALMNILQDLAVNEGKTIITSIHQPSSQIFFNFHKLMLLADGNVVYYGTPESSLSYLQDLRLSCPAGYNAADHWMDLLVVDEAAINNNSEENNDTFEENKGTSDSAIRHRKQSSKNDAASATSPKTKLIEAWDKDNFANSIDDDIQQELDTKSTRSLTLSEDNNDTGAPSSSELESFKSSFNTSWLTQYTVLMHRSLKNSRSAIFTTLNVIKAGAIGVMSGVLWFQMPYTESTVFDRSSYYFFTMTFWVFDAMFTAYMTFPQERTIIFKERSSGAYHLSAYFMAKTTSEAPARLILPAIYMVISYWMSGVNNHFGIFLLSTLCTLLSVCAGESIGLFIGASVFDMERGMVVMTVASLALMVVGGFFVRNVPSWIQWLSYISPFKYSYNSSVQLVFNKPVPCDGSGVLVGCNGGDTGYASIEEVIEFLGIDGSPAFNASLLLAIFVFLRICAFYALKSKKPDERM